MRLKTHDITAVERELLLSSSAEPTSFFFLILCLSKGRKVQYLLTGLFTVESYTSRHLEDAKNHGSKHLIYIRSVFSHCSVTLVLLGEGVGTRSTEWLRGLPWCYSEL